MQRRKIWRVAGINFDHFHMGDLLRMAVDHPRVRVVGLCDEQPARMTDAARLCGLDSSALFTDVDACMESTRPDIVILCPAASRHGEWVRKVAPYGVHLMVEKPFAGDLREADQMIRAMRPGATLMINWPLQWVASHVKAHELVTQGVLGEVLNVWHFGGNRGPLWHGADKVEKTASQVAEEKPSSWFYQRRHGGGSLLDYLGYGATLGSWFQGGRRPVEVMAMADEPPGLEVDEHSIVLLRYPHGLSRLETRWGTFTDPWTIQPQPRCGFIIAGTEGTLTSNDYDPQVILQTRKRPKPHPVRAPELRGPRSNPVRYLVDCLEKGRPLEGPVSVSMSRLGQEIVDAAVRSARTRRAVRL
jgi:predicted dehydrogenase